MTIGVTCSKARQRLASLLDKVTQDREIVIINRCNGESAELIAADELVGLLETTHLLRSPANAQRLLQALNRASKGDAVTKTGNDFANQVKHFVDTYRSTLERLANDDC
jgi:antitoxin YefM